MKYVNIVVFLVLSTIFLLLSSHIKFSTNFLELFFSKQTVELFEVTSKLGLSNNIFISKKGFNENSLNELYVIADELKKIPQITKISISLTPSKELKEYYKQNYYLLADFNNTKLSKEDIIRKLQQEYDKLQNSVIYMPLDTNDPLGLFRLPLTPTQQYLQLKNYGYVLKAKTNIDTASASEAKILYNKIKTILAKHKETIAYAPFFFLVENSSYIRNDTQFIVTLATILLLILYFFMLKDYKLLFHTIIAIGSSVLSAILLSSLFFSKINILVLAFGISITTISIDYMFHYYFHGDFSSKKFIKQKRVFFGFITTFGVFVIFSFIDVKLFRELAFFSAVSLLSAYLLFSWAFSYLDIQPPFIEQSQITVKSFNPLYIILLSLLLLAYSYVNLKFDDNLRNLDYKNERLLSLSKRFREGLEQNRYQAVLISAQSKELLLQNYELLKEKHPDILGIGKLVLSNKRCEKKLQTLQQYDFEGIKKILQVESRKIGFHNAFKNSYANIKNIKCNMQLIDEMEFKIIKNRDRFYTMALLPKGQNLSKIEGVELLSLSNHITQDMQEAKKSIMLFIAFSIAFILLMLFMFSGSHIFYPLTYVLFPLSAVLFFITLFGKINIMHLFALIILIAISIDYGVYMDKTKTLLQTKLAIKYALLSTLAGFGTLIVSDTTALHSIGFVITIGVGAIFILIGLSKNENI